MQIDELYPFDLFLLVNKDMISSCNESFKCSTTRFYLSLNGNFVLHFVRVKNRKKRKKKKIDSDVNCGQTARINNGR